MIKVHRFTIFALHKDDKYYYYYYYYYYYDNNNNKTPTSNLSLYNCLHSPFQSGYLLKFCPQIMDKTNAFKYKPADTKGGAPVRQLAHNMG